MNPLPVASAVKSFSTLAVIGGVAFIAVWIVASLVWGMMVFMGGAMANDAGRVSSERHTALLAMMMLGVAIVGLAGVPGGLALFWSDIRPLLLWTFGGMVVAGAAMQALAAWLFLAAAH